MKPSEYASASTLEFARARGRSGIPPRCLQRNHGIREDGGRAAGASSRGQQSRLYRRGRDGQGHRPDGERAISRRCSWNWGASPPTSSSKTPPSRCGQRMYRGDIRRQRPDLSRRFTALSARKVHDEFVDRLVERTRDHQAGRPVQDGIGDGADGDHRPTRQGASAS